MPIDFMSIGFKMFTSVLLTAQNCRAINIFCIFGVVKVLSFAYEVKYSKFSQ